MKNRIPGVDQDGWVKMDDDEIWWSHKGDDLDSPYIILNQFDGEWDYMILSSANEATYYYDSISEGETVKGQKEACIAAISRMADMVKAEKIKLPLAVVEAALLEATLD